MLKNLSLIVISHYFRTLINESLTNINYMKTYYAFIVLLIALSNQAYAFSLNPYATLDSNLLLYEVDSNNPIKNISMPKHEQHTLNVINKLEINLKNKSEFIEDVIAGVRWNDDPLGMAEFHKKDFFVYFTNSCTSWQSKRITPYWDMLYRTHCGDMQFLHAMASKPDELAEHTHAKMGMWLEFTYKVATGEIGYKTKFSEIPAKLTTDSAKIFTGLMMPDPEYRKDWTPESLFTHRYDRDFNLWNFLTGWLTNKPITSLDPQPPYNCRNAINECVQNVALGSLIHLLQDSYSASHVKRDAGGNIEQFGLYTAQNQSKHKTADDMDIEPCNVNNLDSNIVHTNLLPRQLTDILTLVINSRDLNKDNNNYESSWVEAEKLIAKFLTLNDPKAQAGSIEYE